MSNDEWFRVEAREWQEDTSETERAKCGLANPLRAGYSCLCGHKAVEGHRVGAKVSWYCRPCHAKLHGGE